VEPFLKDEIDRIIRIMPTNKAPGPDGSIVKEDFYQLCQDFFEGHLNLEPINNSFITLVPKLNNPERVNDYRPISLLNCSIKILTKILSERL
jgi:hypothetical protein